LLGLCSAKESSIASPRKVMAKRVIIIRARGVVDVVVVTKDRAVFAGSHLVAIA